MILLYGIHGRIYSKQPFITGDDWQNEKLQTSIPVHKSMGDNCYSVQLVSREWHSVQHLMAHHQEQSPYINFLPDLNQWDDSL